MKGALISAAAAASILLGSAAANAGVLIEYYQVPDAAGSDFNHCCSSPSPATLPNIAIGSSLQGGLPVSLGGPNPVKAVSATGQILWWTPATYTGSAVVSLPYDNNAMYAPGSTGHNDGSYFETAIVSGTILGTGHDVKLTVTSDDDALVYLDGKYVGGNPGVHQAETTMINLGDLTGPNALEIFYADRAQSQAVLDIGLTGAEVIPTAPPGVPEPATWAMLILGVAMIGFAARRRSEGMAFAA
jgi:hypothetical protein